MANCRTPNGGVRESVMRLHEIIGPWDGQMFSSVPHSTPDLPEDGSRVSFENGILTAGFRAGESEDVWVQRSVDLRKVVENEGRELLPRRVEYVWCLAEMEKAYHISTIVVTPGQTVITAQASSAPAPSALHGQAIHPLEVPENLRWRPIRCPVCRLVQDSIMAYGPANRAREV